MGKKGEKGVFGIDFVSKSTTAQRRLLSGGEENRSAVRSGTVRKIRSGGDIETRARDFDPDDART